MEIQDAYKFCPRCGSHMVLEGGHLHCQACGLVFYLNPKPVTSVILKNSKNEYLFTIRANEPFKGKLDFPGGFVDWGEGFEDGGRRELKEELGIEVGSLTYLCTAQITYPSQGINFKLIGVAYTANLQPAAQIKVADDVAGYKFYKLDNVPMEQLADTAMPMFIDRLKELNDS